MEHITWSVESRPDSLLDFFGYIFGIKKVFDINAVSDFGYNDDFGRKWFLVRISGKYQGVAMRVKGFQLLFYDRGYPPRF